MRAPVNYLEVLRTFDLCSTNTNFRFGIVSPNSYAATKNLFGGKRPHPDHEKL